MQTPPLASRTHIAFYAIKDNCYLIQSNNHAELASSSLLCVCELLFLILREVLLLRKVITSHAKYVIQLA